MAEITARWKVTSGLPRERNMGSGRERGLIILPRYGLTGCGRQVPREDVFGPTLKLGWESMVGDEGKTIFQEGKMLMDGERRKGSVYGLRSRNSCWTLLPQLSSQVKASG